MKVQVFLKIQFKSIDALISIQRPFGDLNIHLNSSGTRAGELVTPDNNFCYPVFGSLSMVLLKSVTKFFRNINSLCQWITICLTFW